MCVAVWTVLAYLRSGRSHSVSCRVDGTRVLTIRPIALCELPCGRYSRTYDQADRTLCVAVWTVLAYLRSGRSHSVCCRVGGTRVLTIRPIHQTKEDESRPSALWYSAMSAPRQTSAMPTTRPTALAIRLTVKDG